MCKRCGKCCIRYPCSLLPEDVPAISRFLHLTEEELFRKYLVIDYYCNAEEGDSY